MRGTHEVNMAETRAMNDHENEISTEYPVGGKGLYDIKNDNYDEMNNHEDGHARQDENTEN